MTLFYPSSHYDRSKRGAVFPLLKPFIKTEGFTDADRVAMYHVSEKDFEISNRIEDADFVVLTMSWNYYIDKNIEKQAIEFVKQCDGLNKKVLIWNSGDYGVKIPDFQNTIIFRESGYRSRLSKNEYTLPAFIKDPLKAFYETQFVFELEYESKPVMGFCGQAVLSNRNRIKELALIAFRNIKFYTRISKNEPQQLLSSSYLRAKVLQHFELSDLVISNFIKRHKYRAGVKTGKDIHPTTTEFYNNLKESAYVVCVRGGGNFSVRFFEALAMGRIPVLIDTDSSLPMLHEIPWKEHIVWVEYENRHRASEIVNHFHRELTEAEFVNLQNKNRSLWEDKLTLGGFFKQFLKKQNQ